MRKRFLIASLALPCASFAVPLVENVTLTPDANGRTATIYYEVSNDDNPVIVTLDILKDGVSIGGEKIQRLSGTVNCQVNNGGGEITWEYALDWPEAAAGLSGVQAKVNAYDLSNPPKYMVVSLDVKRSKKVTYYEDAAFIPGGVSNMMYKSVNVIMRHIPARGVTWTMGSPTTEKGRSTNETEHQVTMPHDYWCAIYPLTCAQMNLGCGSVGQTTVKYDNAERPVHKLQYTALRGADSYGTPDEPVENSYLDKLRQLTDIDFDLLSEAQWEFACRAGNYGSV